MIYKKRENINNFNEKNTLPISDEFYQILVNRDYCNENDINSFLYPSIEMLLNPFLFNDMKDIVDKINFCVNNNKKIIIYGDYDVDGTLATSSLFLALSNNNANVSCYIPDRHQEGYGLSKNAINKIIEQHNPYLIITVDCGITSVEEVDYCKSLNVDIIITDHHNPKENLPKCKILDAKIPGENYPFKDLCGTGVVGKLIHALYGIDMMKKYLDLIALATVADLVQLKGENRIFVTMGLSFMNKMLRPGIKGLANYFLKNEKIEAYHLGFKFGPMINACGRLGNASDVVRLMCTNNQESIKEISEKLYNYNEKRKEIEKSIYSECISLLGEDKRKSIVLWSDNWESGVVGIVASKLMNKYNCPVILMAYDKEKNIYHGSGRCIDGINICEILENCKEYIISFGGHYAAAGLKISYDNINNFATVFSRELNKMNEDLFVETYVYDNLLKVMHLNKKLYEELLLVQPCGLGNPSVKFLLKDVSIKNIIARGKSQEHFSCVVFDDSANCEAICFNKKIPDYFDNIDIIGTIDINEYNGTNKIILNIESFKKSDILLQRELASSITQYGIRIMDQPISILGLPEKKCNQLIKANITSIQNLIDYFPKKYLDFRFPKYVPDVIDKETCSIIGTIKKLKQGQGMSYALCEDEQGNTFMPCWFHQDYVIRMLNIGYKYIFCGNIKKNETGFVQIYPDYWSSDINKYKTIVPEYKKISDMSTEYLSSAIDKALSLSANVDFLDKFIVDEFSLLSDYDSTKKLHHPANDFDIRDGQRRKVFNDLFKFNFILKSKAPENVCSQFIFKKNSSWDYLYKLLPYSLTNDQQNCLNDVFSYLKTGKILNALVQGDVGSGKTMIGLFSMLAAAENGYQSCIIAPTEVLAKQHYIEISGYMSELGYKVGYLVGGLKTKERRAILSGLADGSIDMVVGTHAIIQDSVKFAKLGLVVIDEQHRFGVGQREKLLNTENGPHIITMSATPIPRTLSMALYGDNIQVYNILEKPAGRKVIITEKKTNIEEINYFMLEEIRKGRQCYVVCPLIEESKSEAMAEVSSVKQEVENLISFFANFPEVKIANTTGRMKKEVISSEIEKFVKNEANILVSTTIIEVGVNVPNATVMVLKSSERFGLAQAHQLRGRVGRGSHQSYCILQTSKDDPKADILCNNSDGFEIAKQDLLLRGPGDYIGKDQTGSNKNVLLMMAEPDLYKDISKLNDRIFENSALYSKYEYILEEN